MPWLELLKWLCFKSSNHTLPAIFLAIFEQMLGNFDPKFIDKGLELKQQLEELLGETEKWIFNNAFS